MSELQNSYGSKVLHKGFHKFMYFSHIKYFERFIKKILFILIENSSNLILYPSPQKFHVLEELKLFLYGHCWLYAFKL